MSHIKIFLSSFVSRIRSGLLEVVLLLLLLLLLYWTHRKSGFVLLSGWWEHHLCLPLKIPISFYIF